MADKPVTRSVLKQPLPIPPPIVRAHVPALLAATILECLAAEPALRPTARALLASVEAADDSAASAPGHF